jgi:hypothetical protein
MERMPRLSIPLAVAAVAAAVAAAAGLAAPRGHAAPLPAWSVDGEHDLTVPTGFRSVSGAYEFVLGEGDDAATAGLSLSYDQRARLSGGGVISGATAFSFYSLRGQWTWDAGTGQQEVRLEEATRRPRFTFVGVQAPDGGHVTGTYERSDGFAAMAGNGSGPLVLARQDTKGGNTFRMHFQARMDAKGRVKGGLESDGKTEKRGWLLVHGGTLLEGGKVRGQVKTRKRDGLTTGKVKVKGRGWQVVLVGPLDEDGFHALAKVKAAGFLLKDVPLRLAVKEGPEPPPPPPPPKPKYFLSGATATVVGASVEVRHGSVPKRFFGKQGDLTVQFGSGDQSATVTADPSTWSGVATPRRFFVQVGGRTFSTEFAPGGVELVNVRAGSVLTVRARGQVVAPNGKVKTVDIELEAVVAQ